MPATQREIDFAESLEIFHDRIISKIAPKLEELRRLRNSDNSHLLDGQILYWDHVIAALKWSTAQAKQKAGKK
jgi:hypothetical protein